MNRRCLAIPGIKEAYLYGRYATTIPGWRYACMIPENGMFLVLFLSRGINYNKWGLYQENQSVRNPSWTRKSQLQDRSWLWIRCEKIITMETPFSPKVSYLRILVYIDTDHILHEHNIKWKAIFTNALWCHDLIDKCHVYPSEWGNGRTAMKY